MAAADAEARGVSLKDAVLLAFGDSLTGRLRAASVAVRLVAQGRLRGRVTKNGTVERIDGLGPPPWIVADIDAEVSPTLGTLPREASLPPTAVSGPVFLGHGRAPLWREVKDGLEDMGLRVEAFESSSTVGMPTQQRLEDLLNTCRFAVILMTPEDRGQDGDWRARQNVVHEAGLFQGRYGFRRVCVVLCGDVEEFSNISGLGQVRKDDASAIVHEIFLQLRREFPEVELG